MEDPGQYEAVFLSPDVNLGTPFLFEYQGGMVYPMSTKNHELIAEADVDAVVIDET